MASRLIKTLELQDCQSISRAFEKGASFAVTEESVFAMMTPILTNMRISAQNTVDQIENADSVAASKTNQEKIQSQASGQSALGASDERSKINIRNMDKSNDEDEGLLTKIRGDFLPGGEELTDFGGAFDSRCIPCGFRINMYGDLIQQSFSGAADVAGNILESRLEFLKQHFAQLQELINLFSQDASKFVDLCALIKFLKEFVCIPDLRRIMSALMALMMDVAIEFNGIFDLILSLIAPLFTPFISSLLDSFQQFILAVLKPLECIVESIQNLISKLDYGVLFDNINQLQISVGPRLGGEREANQGRPPAFRSSDVKLPYLQHGDTRVGGESLTDDDIPFPNLHFTGETTGTRAIDFNLNPLAQAEIAEEQAAVEKASEELNSLNRAAANVDASNPDEVERHAQQVQSAKQRYKQVVEERDSTKIQQLNKRIGAVKDRTFGSFKSSLFSLIGFLREIMIKFNQFFADLFDELKRLTGEYLGGSGSMINIMFKKLALVQLIGFIAALIKAFASGASCGDEQSSGDTAEDIRIENIVPIQQNTKVWTDENGDLHIEEQPDEINAAIDDVIKAFGIIPVSSDRPVANDPERDPRARDKGVVPSEQDPGKKLKSLIEFTGDPVLDAEIARTTEALTTPVRVTFKCPLQTSVADAEQVNTWIQELNTR